MACTLPSQDDTVFISVVATLINPKPWGEGDSTEGNKLLSNTTLLYTHCSLPSADCRFLVGGGGGAALMAPPASLGSRGGGGGALSRGGPTLLGGGGGRERGIVAVGAFCGAREGGGGGGTLKRSVESDLAVERLT